VLGRLTRSDSAPHPAPAPGLPVASMCFAGGMAIAFERTMVRGVGAVLAVALLACHADSHDVILVGTVERTLIDLVSPASERITAIEVERGSHVRAGEVVVRLDPTFALADLAVAEAELAGARTSSSIAGSDFDRATALHQSNVISREQLDRARLARDEAATRLWAAEARVAAMRKRSSDLTLVAPVDGVVDQLPFDTGERVPTGAVLAVILRDGPPWVRVWLPERTFARVGPGTEMRVSVDGVSELHGHILDIAREPEFTPHFALTEYERAYLVYETRVVLDDAPASLRAGAPARIALRVSGTNEEARR
jgi:HlyD family secretion protein